MKHSLHLLISAFFMAILISCGTSTQTPEQLGEKVFATLQNNDVNAFMKLCGTTKDAIAIARMMDVSAAEKKEAMNFGGKNRSEIDDELESERREDFAKTYEAIDWASAKIDRIELSEIEVDKGISFSSEIIVHLVGGRVLEITDIIKGPKGWIVMNERPLHIY